MRSDRNIWQLHCLRGTVFPLCAVTASVAALRSPSGTVAECPQRLNRILQKRGLSSAGTGQGDIAGFCEQCYGPCSYIFI
jgi:hypothetical protein